VIAAFDLDGTLLKRNSSFLFCRFLRKKKVLSRLDLLFCTLTYIRHLCFGLSLKDVHQTIFNHLFKGRNVNKLIPYVNIFIKKQLDEQWYQPALVRLRALKKRGARIMVLSNSPRFIVEPIARLIGVEDVLATEYSQTEEGRLIEMTHLMDGTSKGAVLRQILGKKIVAFSDTLHDLPFLESAHIAVAVNPNRSLKRVAKLRGWEIL